MASQKCYHNELLQSSNRHSVVGGRKHGIILAFMVTSASSLATAADTCVTLLQHILSDAGHDATLRCPWMVTKVSIFKYNYVSAKTQDVCVCKSSIEARTSQSVE